jgi:hypothetical protein
MVAAHRCLVDVSCFKCFRGPLLCLQRSGRYYRNLAGTDPANDGLVAASDAIVSGSTLLGYPNADHLAVAMPFEANPLT